MSKMLKLVWLFAFTLTSTSAAIALFDLSPAIASPTQTCAYDTNSGRPNPLGMRAFVSAVEEDGNTTFKFEQFPSPVGNGENRATIASTRELTFYGTGVESARLLMLQNPGYYSELLGYSNPDGFEAVNAVLVCQAGAIANEPSPLPSPSPSPLSSPSPSPSPRPTASTVTIAALPDGNYRYWNGQPSGSVVTDEELLSAGGVLFVFRKTGSQITGAFSHIDGEAICITGQANGNTITGFAYPYNGSISNTGTAFTSWGPSGFLQVRRGHRSGGQSRYDSALLNLNGFSRINAGSRIPPRSCP